MTFPRFGMTLGEPITLKLGVHLQMPCWNYIHFPAVRFWVRNVGCPPT